MQFESMLYSHADKFISGYSGAYWHYVNYNLNGHKIMFAYPDFADVVSMVNHDNYYEGTMTSIECGLSLTIFVLNRLIWKAYNSKQHELQRKLQQANDKTAKAAYDTAMKCFGECVETGSLKIRLNY